MHKKNFSFHTEFSHLSYSCAMVAVGYGITKLLCSSEYQGHQVEFFCREMPLKKDFSPSLVIISLLNSLGIQMTSASCVWCFPRGRSGLLCSLYGTSGKDWAVTLSLPCLCTGQWCFPHLVCVHLVWTPALSVGSLHKDWTWLLYRVTFPSGLTCWARWHGIRKQISDPFWSAAAAAKLL